MLPISSSFTRRIIHIRDTATESRLLTVSHFQLPAAFTSQDI
jgi:hypothetical protein